MERTVKIEPYNAEAMRLFLAFLAVKFKIPYFVAAYVNKWYKEGYQALVEGHEVSPKMIDMVVQTYNYTFHQIAMRNN